MLKPPPDREEFEKEIKRLVSNDGDIRDLAGYISMDQTHVSRWFNPQCPERVNPLYLTTKILWGFDCMRPDLADNATAVINRRRMLWLPAPIVAVDPADTTSNLLTQFRELMESEMKDLPDDQQLVEAQDVVRAAQTKVDEILARIEQRRPRG